MNNPNNTDNPDLDVSDEVVDVTPDAIEAKTTRQRSTVHAREQGRARGVDWVRPTDLMARHSAAIAGRGIDFHTELSRRTRTGITTSTRNLSARARQLPPLSAFGRRTASRVPMTRGPVGTN